MTKMKMIKKFKKEVEKLTPEQTDKFNKEIMERLDILRALIG